MDGKIAVFDVWDSQEAFDAFGATLMPILTELGDRSRPSGGDAGAQRDRRLSEAPASGGFKSGAGHQTNSSTAPFVACS